MRLFGIGALVVAGIVFYFNFMAPPANPIPASFIPYNCIYYIGNRRYYIPCPPQKVGGRWTQEGVDFDAQWNGFKDTSRFSQMKKVPTRVSGGLEPLLSIRHCFRCCR